MLCANLVMKTKGCAPLRMPFAEFVKSELRSGVLLITCGLPGTWKTETSQEVSKIKGYPVLRTDLIRLEILKNEDISDVEIFQALYDAKKNYEELLKVSELVAETDLETFQEYYYRDIN